jgi:heptosyltransferase III
VNPNTKDGPSAVLPPSGQVRRILFVGWTRIGDAVISTSLIAYLLEHYPEARLTLVCGPLAEQVLHTVPRLDRLIVLTKQPWNRHWLSLVWVLLGSRWDLVIDLRDSAVSYAVRSPQTLRFRKADVPRRRVEELADMVGLSTPPWPRLWLGAGQVAAADQVLAGHTGPILAVAPGAGRPEKLWPVEQFAALVRQLTAPDGTLAGAALMLLGGPGESALAAQMRLLLPDLPVIDLVDRLDLLSQAACMARASLFVGNDSGLTHVAAALGIPTVSVFGPTDPRQYAPFGPRAGYAGGTVGGRVRQIDEITVAEVAAAISRILT